MKRLLFAFLFCTATLSLDASTVLISFTAEATESNLVGASSDARLADAVISRGGGLLPRDDFEGYYDSRNWSTSATFEGIDDTTYLSISFAVDPMYEWVPESISLAYQDGGSLESARRLQLRSSHDGFAETLFVDTSVNGFPFPNDVNAVALSALTPQSGLVEFRLYGFAASSSEGVLGLANDMALAVDDSPRALLISGELVAIPEPSLWLLTPALLGTLAILVRLRRSP